MTFADVDAHDASFAAAIGGRQTAAAPREGPLAGIEHEYQVLDPSGRQVDFRAIIHELSIDGLRLDPGDVNAYRLTSGMALTCDAAEAEVASPPIPVQPGFTGELQRWAALGLQQLRRILPGDLALAGYSTHISISVPDAIVDEVAELYAVTFAPALALLMESPSSNGIYVRPRPGRLELCGEYVTGPRLGAATAFAAGSTAACVAAVRGQEPRGSLPPRLALQLLPGEERYGLRVHRHAAGLDLYSEGRGALLPREDAKTITGQEMIEDAWHSARLALGGAATTGDLDLIDRMVAGALPLGVEGWPGPPGHQEAGDPEPTPEGAILCARDRGGFRIAPHLATWDVTVFSCEGATRSIYASVPRHALGAFLRRLDTGDLDELLSRSLANPSAGRVLQARSQVASPGLFDEVGSPSALLPEEREPVPSAATGQESKRARSSSMGARAGKGAAATGRVGKVLPLPLPLPPGRTRHGPSSPTAPPPPIGGPGPAPGPPRPLWPIVAGVVVIGLALLGLAAALFLQDESPDTVDVTPTVAPSAPPGSATPAVPTSTPVAAAGAATPTTTATASPSATPAATATEAGVAGAAATATPTAAATPTATATPTVRPTETRVPTATLTPTRTPTPSPTATATPTFAPPPPTPGCVSKPGAVCP